MSHVFISYAHADKTYARKLADHLIANGFDVWIDDRIDFGANWEYVIFDALKTCAAYIIIMSSTAYQRPWVQSERLYAQRLNKPTFPLLLEGDVFPIYGALQSHNVSDGNLPPDKFFKDLAKLSQPKIGIGKDIATTLTQSSNPSVSKITSFWLRGDQIIFTSNFANLEGCNWQGIGGQVFDQDGKPVLNLKIRVVGTGGFERFALTGSNVLYGEAGWEIPLSTQPSNDSYIVELYFQDGTRISPQFTLTFPAKCDANLALVIFEQRS